MKKKVLFVCSANTCRSAVMAAILTEYGHRRYDVSSAGIFARTGEPMMQECADALETLFGHGFSGHGISGHGSAMSEKFGHGSSMSENSGHGERELVRIT